METDLTILVLALHKDVLEEVVKVVLHLLVRDVGQVRAVGRLEHRQNTDNAGEDDLILAC